MEGSLIRINRWLLPLSWIYRFITGMRNALFDMGALPSHSYDIPIISVGNITVGGTGKTPHIEYLIRLLYQQHRTAVLSRGYKRKSKGYVLAGTDSPMEQTGDEPWQMKQKFPGIHVAVDANRRRGISRLCYDEETRDVEVILLDDAYQHRYVKPGINILLVDYNRMITDDQLLPAGCLRESLAGKSRADIVIVTKCPRNAKPMEFRVAQNALNLRPYQALYFSTLRYGELKHLDGHQAPLPLDELTGQEHLLLLTAIASPWQMAQEMQPRVRDIQPLAYPDHHYFTPADVEEINQRFRAMKSPKLIVTTEKDASRLAGVSGLDEEVRKKLYVLPIEVEIMGNQAESFNEKITGYVLKNSRNSILAQG